MSRFGTVTQWAARRRKELVPRPRANQSGIRLLAEITRTGGFSITTIGDTGETICTTVTLLGDVIIQAPGALSPTVLDRHNQAVGSMLDHLQHTIAGLTAGTRRLTGAVWLLRLGAGAGTLGVPQIADTVARALPQDVAMHLPSYAVHAVSAGIGMAMAFFGVGLAAGLMRRALTGLIRARLQRLMP